MTYLFNVLYLFVLVLLSPWLVYKACTTGKYRRGMAAKFFGSPNTPTTNDKFTAWFHGVSVGEIHLLRQVVAKYRERHPEHRVVVSSTTDTGFDEARKWFPDLEVIWWPLDFSWAVKRSLSAIRPDLVLLAESEVWPNFLRIAKARGIRLALLNGRMSPKSAVRWEKMSVLARAWFGRFDVIAAQTDEYADRFRRLGAENVLVTGNVKYDGAVCDPDNPRTQSLRELFGVRDDQILWVAGSTQAPEEKVVLDIYLKLRQRFPALRLFLVPRQKDRFDEVAGLLAGTNFVRRSGVSEPLSSRDEPPIVLLDTMGELNALWGLADIAFVGGSLDGQRGGQNMIEPAAYGAAVTFGPHVWNFKNAVELLLQHEAAIQVRDADNLADVTERLIADVELRRRLGERAQAFVRSQQGATAKTLDALYPPLAA